MTTLHRLASRRRGEAQSGHAADVQADERGAHLRGCPGRGRGLDGVPQRARVHEGPQARRKHHALEGCDGPARPASLRCVLRAPRPSDSAPRSPADEPRSAVGARSYRAMACGNHSRSARGAVDSDRPSKARGSTSSKWARRTSASVSPTWASVRTCLEASSVRRRIPSVAI